MVQTIEETKPMLPIDEDEHLKIITWLLRLQSELNAAPKREGSKFGKIKTKPRQRLEEHCMLYSNHFADELTYTLRKNVDDNLG
jgi:hypothetical protein